MAKQEGTGVGGGGLSGRSQNTWSWDAVQPGESQPRGHAGLDGDHGKWYNQTPRKRSRGRGRQPLHGAGRTQLGLSSVPGVKAVTPCSPGAGAKALPPSSLQGWEEGGVPTAPPVVTGQAKRACTLSRKETEAQRRQETRSGHPASEWRNQPPTRLSHLLALRGSTGALEIRPDSLSTCPTALPGRPGTPHPGHTRVNGEGRAAVTGALGSPRLERKSTGRARGKEKPGRWTAGCQGRAPPTPHSPPAGGPPPPRLLLPPRRQRCHGDHHHLATEPRPPGHLPSLLWLWEGTCVQKPPCLRKPTCGDKTGRLGREGTGGDPAGRIRGGTLSCKAFIFVKIGNSSFDLWAHEPPAGGCHLEPGARAPGIANGAAAPPAGRSDLHKAARAGTGAQQSPSGPEGPYAQAPVLRSPPGWVVSPPVPEAGSAAVGSVELGCHLVADGEKAAHQPGEAEGRGPAM
ncbi:translation initiation factor IF-2-like [Herpailurus yagouaroundi]|uniref:translation initiation factor IF-2-like n=1 Tax=Herpailurus yagouaroundi TaxID=1608482 RepID=UPI001AD7C9C4|nr:translation initiation factor IF-2-like [Puma yagouaroundi]